MEKGERARMDIYPGASEFLVTPLSKTLVSVSVAVRPPEVVETVGGILSGRPPRGEKGGDKYLVKQERYELFGSHKQTYTLIFTYGRHLVVAFVMFKFILLYFRVPVVFR